MKLSPLRAALFGAAAVSFVLPLHDICAVALVTYDFETYTVNADTGAAPSTTAVSPTGLLASSLAPNAGTVTPATGFLGRGGSGNAGNYFFTSATAPIAPSTGAGRSVGTQSQYTFDTIANAVAGATYYSFTLTPSAGANLSFAAADTFTFSLQVRSLSGTGTVPYNVQFFLRSSVDNYAADIGSSAVLGVTATTTNVSADRSISLGSLGTLAASQAITFRIYPVDNQQALAQDDFKFDNVVVNGAVTVPEPTTFAAVGLGMVSIALLRRRMR